VSFLSKLGSRKFLTALAGIIVGVAMAFGPNDDTVRPIAGSVTSIVSTVVYIFAQAKLDAGK